MKRIAITLTGVLISISAIAAEPYEGTWATDVPECLLRYGGDGLVTIRGKEYKAWEQNCRITSTRKVGSKTTAAMICNGEGETWKDTVTFEVLGIHRLSMGKNDIKIRCPNLPNEAKADALQKLWHEANTVCRESKSAKACSERTSLARGLLDYDRCYGKHGEANDQMSWHACMRNSRHPE